MKKIYVIGIGPGEADQITPKAKEAIHQCDVVAGYRTYIKLIADYINEKKIIETGMRSEVERCELALMEAKKDKCVCMVCSGDSGVYGMAGLIYELAETDAGCDVEIEVIAGITAACSGAAVLGAPLMHDFCVISLSDLMTPWEQIEKRLRMAAKGDFCIVLYNPSSRHRPDYLKKACLCLLEDIPPSRVCGFVRNIGREGQEYIVCSLDELKDAQVDMFTTVFIGNSQTRKIQGKMVTPRGYQL